MYIETMQQVFSNTSKVMVDSRGSGNPADLPLDKLMQRPPPGASTPVAEAGPQAGRRLRRRRATSRPPRVDALSGEARTP